MTERKALSKAAKRLIASTQGILGPRAIQDAVKENIQFLDVLRQTGASWEQIAKFLKAEGLRTKRGEIVSAGVLRILFTRAKESAVARSATTAKSSNQESAQTRRSSIRKIQKEATSINAWADVEERMRRAARLRGDGSI